MHNLLSMQINDQGNILDKIEIHKGNNNKEKKFKL